MPPHISVVIPVKNDERKIGNAIEGVLNQTIPPCEIIIVDGHSTDNTVALASTYPVSVIFEEYGTVGGARQAGVEKSNGDYIAFTDSDCIPERTWLENLVKEFQTDIVGVGGGIKNIGAGIWEESISLALDSFLGSANSVQDRVLKTKRYVKSISGCNSMYRKRDVLNIGGFNTRYSMNEDTDLNQRLQQYGKIVYTPDAVVLHNQERNLLQFCKRMYAFGYGRGEHHLWDLQIIPPIAAAGMLALLVLSPVMFFALFLLYIVLIGGYSVLIFIRARKPAYLIAIPVVFIVEHVAYTFGFWMGILSGKLI
jgi:glycosyltransferase involved in cell wall biosynthesis